MTFEQAMMTIINEKMYQRKEISEDIHDKMQMHINHMDKIVFDSEKDTNYNNNEAMLLSCFNEEGGTIP